MLDGVAGTDPDAASGVRLQRLQRGGERLDRGDEPPVAERLAGPGERDRVRRTLQPAMQMLDRARQRYRSRKIRV